MSPLPILHATTLALWRGGDWRAVLLRGPSGVGKSDLALRALAAGWRLVADDRSIVWCSGGRLFARAPDSLSGLIEARGLGVVRAPPLAWAPVALTVDLVSSAATLERVPEPDSVEIEGVRLPRIELFALESSAPAKLVLALEAATLGSAKEASYQARSADVAKAPGVAPGASQEE